MPAANASRIIRVNLRFNKRTYKTTLKKELEQTSVSRRRS